MPKNSYYLDMKPGHSDAKQKMRLTNKNLQFQRKILLSVNNWRLQIAIDQK